MTKKKSRKFDGKTFWFHGTTKYKRIANDFKDNMKHQNCLVRIVKRRDGKYDLYWRQHYERKRKK